MPGDDCDTGFDVLIMNFICGYPCNDGKEGRVCGCGQIVPECAEQINQYINQNGYPAYAEPGKPLGTVDSNYIHTAAWTAAGQGQTHSKAGYGTSHKDRCKWICEHRNLRRWDKRNEEGLQAYTYNCLIEKAMADEYIG